jgi:hypothetical protein
MDFAPGFEPLTGERAANVVEAARAYLACWTPDRIWRLQRMDGGWGPFDDRGRPEPIYEAADIARISQALNHQRRELAAAGIELAPEFLELHLYFAISSRLAGNTLSNPVGSSARAPGTDKAVHLN